MKILRLAAIAVVLSLPPAGSLALAEEGRPDAGSIKVAAVGDVMMGSEGRMPADGGVGSFKAAAPYLKGADVVFLNHEGVLADRGAPTKPIVKGRSYCFRTPPAYARFMAEAGFNMVSLANNHSFDYNREGLDQTQETLRKHGIQYSHHSGSLARLNVRGARVVMAAFWIYSGDKFDLNDIPRAKRIVSELAAENDVVIVSMHGGAEGTAAIHTPKGMDAYLGEKRGDLPAFSHAVVDAGADLVLGHGPHVPRAMEIYKGRLIAYSLGNFCTMGFGTSSYLGYAPMLLAELDREGRLVGGQVASFIQTRMKPPAFDPKNRAAEFIHQMGREDFPQTNAVDPDGKLIPRP